VPAGRRRSFYSPDTCFEAWAQPHAGHGNNVHFGAPAWFAYVMNWAANRVMSPTGPC
jgi:hypothetical protein